jgi:hypothetical protein
VSETTHNQETLFAIEVEPAIADLNENLAIYRRLTVRQKSAIAAELRRKVQTEIAKERQASRRRPRWIGVRAWPFGRSAEASKLAL